MKKLLLAATVLGSFALGSAQATIIPGSGFTAMATGISGSGNSGTDAYGNPWLWSTALSGESAWGLPGLGKSTINNYGGPVPATDFEISFLYTGSASIDTTPSPGAGGYNEMTRFDVCGGGGCVEWTPVFVSKNQVNFIAPAGSSLVTGENYFVNVLFKGGTLDGSTSGFSAVYTYGDTIPEPATIAILGAGLLGLGLASRRRG